MKTVRAILFCLFVILVYTGRADATTNYTLGNKLYAEGRYSDAIAAYRKAADEVQSQEIYYNLGNAYFKNKHIARAILYYEKALKINPEFELAKQNLEIANSQIADRIEPPARQQFSTIWNEFVKDTGVKVFSAVTLVLWLIGGFLIGLFIAGRRNAVKKAGFFGGLTFIVFGSIALYLAFSSLAIYTDQNAGIIITPKVDVKTAPNSNSTDAFILHEGTKVQLGKSEGNWVEVTLTSGNFGWLKKTDIAEI